MENEYRLNEDWRDRIGDDMVMLSNGMVVPEEEVYFALEKCLEYIQHKYSRFPTEDDIETFILALRGP